MKRSARILSLLLAVLMLAVCFAACKKDDQQKDNPDDNKLDLSKTDSWTDEQWLAYEQSLDYGGRTFTLMTHQRNRRSPNEENPTQIDTDLDNLIKQFESDLNVSFEIADKWVDGATLATWTASGENPADVYDSRPSNWLPYAAKGAIFNWASDEAKSYGVNVKPV